MPAPAATSRLAVRNQPIAPTAPPVASAPSFLPMTLLRMRPRIGTPTKRKSARSCQSKPPRPRGRDGAVSARGAGSFSPATSAPRRSTRDVEAAGEVAGLERRQDLLADDAAGGDVGDRALQRRRDLDVDVAVVLGDRQQQAVADFLAAQLPARGDALRERGDVLGPRRRHDQDHDLRAALLLDRRELGAERLGLRRRQRRGLVDDAAGEDRHRHDVFGASAGPKTNAASSGRRGEDSAHRAPSRSARRGLVEAHRRRHRDLRLVGDREARLGLVAEDHRREVASARCAP